MSTTKIDWCDTVWNPIVGCSRVSEGCRNCYAERFARRLAKNPKIKGKYKDVVRWDGTTTFDSFAVDIPLKWKKPRRIFINSMGDLFCSSVDPRWIDEILQIIGACPQHSFYALTKRPENIEEKLFGVTEARPCRVLGGGDYLKNLWLGVSVENQETADERIPELLKMPGFKKFISVEPMLGPVDLNSDRDYLTQILSTRFGRGPINKGRDRLDWVICGGETGPGARPLHPDWVRSLRDQCKAAGVPFFFKSWGEWGWYQGGHSDQKAKRCFVDGDFKAWMVRVGKKRAGHLLDGKAHREIPA